MPGGADDDDVQVSPRSLPLIARDQGQGELRESLRVSVSDFHTRNYKSYCAFLSTRLWPKYFAFAMFP